MRVTLIQVGRFAQSVTHRFTQKRCLMAAGALSFTSLLALVPLAAMGLALFSFFPAFAQTGQMLTHFILSSFAPHIGEGAVVYFGQFLTNAQKLAAPGIIILIITAMMLWIEIEAVFDDIWDINARRRVMTRLMAFWILPTLGPLLLGIGLSVVQHLASEEVSANLLPVLLEIAGFSLLYYALPQPRVNPWHAMIGGVTAGLMFEAAKAGFGFYVKNFSAYEAIYGALSALPVFLIWMYVSWAVALFGAVVTAELPKWKAGPTQ